MSKKLKSGRSFGKMLQNRTFGSPNLDLANSRNKSKMTFLKDITGFWTEPFVGLMRKKRDVLSVEDESDKIDFYALIDEEVEMDNPTVAHGQKNIELMLFNFKKKPKNSGSYLRVKTTCLDPDLYNSKSMEYLKELTGSIDDVKIFYQYTSVNVEELSAICPRKISKISDKSIGLMKNSIFTDTAFLVEKHQKYEADKLVEHESSFKFNVLDNSKSKNGTEKTSLLSTFSKL